MFLVQNPIFESRLWLGTSLAVTLDTGAEGSVGQLSLSPDPFDVDLPYEKAKRYVEHICAKHEFLS